MTYLVRLESEKTTSEFRADSPDEAAESYLLVRGVDEFKYAGDDSTEVVCVVTDSTGSEWRVTVYISWVAELSSDAVLLP